MPARIATVAEAEPDAYDEVIDVRSPSEWRLDHVPTAVNLPVLDDAERAEVGTIYKKIHPFEARKVGAALVSRNIAAHLESHFRDKPKSYRPLIYCWRGGQRSDGMAAVLSRIGFAVTVLEGGYKTWRKQVISGLETGLEELRFRVIAGMTGTGKTRLLNRLARHGHQVLDLEGMANHRGSLLGAVDLGPQPGQKLFETRLWEACRKLAPARPVFVEAESRRIGAVSLPARLLARMRSGEASQIRAPLGARVAFTLSEYEGFTRDPDALKHAVRFLTRLRGKAQVDEWIGMIDAGDFPGFVADIMRKHYDLAYARSLARSYGDDVRPIDLPALEDDNLDRAMDALVG